MPLLHTRLLPSRPVVALLLAGGVAACTTPPAPVGSTPEAFAPETLEAYTTPDGAFDEGGLNFLIVGDWGRNGFFNQRNVGRAMGVTADEIDARFTISTGDNFYTEGVQSTEDPKWERSFEDIYDAESLMHPWYATLGNHDWQGDYTAQIAYSDVSERWNLPARYYTHTERLPGGQTALFVYLDTTPLSEPDENRRKYEQTEDWDREAQLAWLRETLAGSDADWKIVSGHHPIYVGSTRYEDNPRLIELLVPIFEEHGVQVYFAGHDHNLQHLRPEGSPVDYFVSGAGSLTRGVVETPNTLFGVRTSGYMAASFVANELHVNSYDEDGALLYATTVPKSRPDTHTPREIEAETDLSDPEVRRDLEAAEDDDGDGSF